jgi:hypothetical protein
LSDSEPRISADQVAAVTFAVYELAKAQCISPDWLFDGDLRSHPRGPAPREKQPRNLRRLADDDGDAA